MEKKLNARPTRVLIYMWDVAQYHTCMPNIPMFCVSTTRVSLVAGSFRVSLVIERGGTNDLGNMTCHFYDK